MDNRKILDQIEKVDPSRFSLLSFRVFVLSVFIFLLFLILAFTNPGFEWFEHVIFLIVVGFMISTIAGFVLAIMSIVKKEPITFIKTVGVIGNLLFSIVMLGMILFVIGDLLVP